MSEASLRRPTARLVVDIVLGVATVAGLLVGGAALFTGALPQSIMAGVLGGIAVVSVGAVVWLANRHNQDEQTLARSARWNVALANISKAIGELSSVSPTRDQNHAVDAEDFRRAVEAAAPHIAYAFGSVTESPECHVTVKQVFSSGDRMAVRTLVSTAERQVVLPPKHVDWVDANTDFAHIIQGKAERDYCSNDLYAELSNGYRNSHFSEGLLERASSADDLPYAATMVWPVRTSVGKDAQGRTTWRTLGFLCVDSPKPHVFDRRLDAPIGAVLANALYLVWPAERTREGDR